MDLVGDACPTELEYRRTSGGRHLCIQVSIVQKRIQAFCKEAGAAWHQKTRLSMSHNAGESSSSRRHHGRSTGKRLNGNQAKTLMIGWHDRHISGTIDKGKLLLRSRSQKMDALADIQLRGHGLQLL